MKIKNLIFVSLLIFSGNVFSAHSKNLKSNFVTGEILVKYKATMSSFDQSVAIEREGGVRIGKQMKKGWNRVKLKKTLNIKEAIEEFKQDPDVLHAQPNYIYHALLAPNDPRYGQLWGLKNTGQTIISAGGPDTPRPTNNPGVSGKDMNLEYAWNTITDCSSVIVAVIDTGINYNQGDLVNNMWDGGASYPNHGYDFVNNDNDPMDSNGHGTHVAGTIGAVGNNGTGSTGVCWKVKLMAIRVLDTTGSGTSADIIDGINFAVDNGAKVINMSLGGSEFGQFESDAMTYALNHNVLVVAAAGNDGTNNDDGSTLIYPCDYAQNNIVCVAALAQDYSLASFSNYGITHVDVGAPGVNIVSTWPGTHSSVTDTLKAGWSFSSTAASGWGYKDLNFGSPVSCLVNPTNYNYSTAKYLNNMDARAWKSFNPSSVDVATLNFYLMTDVDAGDSISIYSKSGTTDPMASGTKLDTFSGTTYGYREPFEYEITSLLGSPFSIGFNLVTDSSGVDLGVNVSNFSIDTLAYNTTSYNVISGTSMAAPHVAGLAAMIYAYNPSYTYSDVANSIKRGGVATASLAGKTSTGKAVSAIGSLNYINTPTGVAAVKVP
ncbi:S8 family peptidase [Bacteriovorax sp. PP10]|uniref:S8 family peptidase n=1 Tax=Bacteriovorax antarcticus TaxID=3088717 RepID=A0ABU5VZQ8_9BACT|nr:S8 family peptidase [Bacteriovorax sp. PP10]MEA9358558.1 S8 family peptidase [Bacteriovorax sp. PP10]